MTVDPAFVVVPPRSNNLLRLVCVCGDPRLNLRSKAKEASLCKGDRGEEQGDDPGHPREGEEKDMENCGTMENFEKFKVFPFVFFFFQDFLSVLPK